MDIYNNLFKEAKDISIIINEYENKLNRQKEKMKHTESEIKKLLPKGYWWSSDINKNFVLPKKYSIKNVEFDLICEDVCITVKESLKKKPWKNYDDEEYYYLEDFLKLNIYKTEEEAKKAVYNRICPNCGGVMKYTIKPWCDKCIEDRWNKMLEYEKTHVFYEPNKKLYYTMGYTDELTCDKGFGGKHFIFKRLDTDEIIESDNLWSSCSHRGNANVPEIEFLTT